MSQPLSIWSKLIHITPYHSFIHRFRNFDFLVVSNDIAWCQCVRKITALPCRHCILVPPPRSLLISTESLGGLLLSLEVTCRVLTFFFKRVNICILGCVGFIFYKKIINPARNRYLFCFNHGTKRMGGKKGEKTVDRLRACCSFVESRNSATKIFHL